MKLRKILSTVLAISMIAAMVPFRASADDWDDWDDEEECEEHDFSVIKTETPTCEDEGYSYHVCSKCGEDMGDMFDFVEPLGHVWGEWEIADEPTCEDPGYLCRHCTRAGCTEYEEEEIEALGHNFEFVKTVTPTCEEPGYELYMCSRKGCGEEEKRNEVPATGHAWQVVQGGEYHEATCDHPAEIEVVCSTCGARDLVEEGEPLGHDWGEWTVTKEPTHCMPGEKTRTCTVCGKEEEEEISALEPFYHTWGDWKVEDEPTCEDDGCECRYCECEDCDAYEERSIDSLGGHIWKFVKTVPPTCEDYGYDLYECTRDGCDAEEERNYVDELGGDHEWVKSEVVDPTCTEDGYTVYVCSVCGDTDHDDYTEPLGHTYKDGHCIRCGAPDPADSCIAVEQYSLTLDSDIAVNFKVRVPATLIDKATPVFTFDGQKSTVEFGKPIAGTTDRYIISYHIVPKRMGSEVWLEMQDKSGSRIELVDPDDEQFYNNICKYSVIDYCEMAHKELHDDNLLNLVDALQDYGYYAQKYFGTYEDIDEPISNISAVTQSDLAGYSVTKSGADLGISETAMSLVLESKTKIRHRFVLDEGHSIDEFTFTCGGKTLTPVGSGNSYSVTIEDIAGQDLDKDMTITVTSSATSGEYVVTGSALAYCKLALEKKSDDTALCDLIKAMYLYNQAANAYCGSSGGSGGN